MQAAEGVSSNYHQSTSFPWFLLIVVSLVALFFLTMPLLLISIKRSEDRLKTTASDYLGIIV